MVKFYSTNTNVATINETTGRMRVIAPGSVEIIAKDKKSSKLIARKRFTVLQRANSVSVEEGTNITMNVGDTFKITAIKEPTTSTDVIRFMSEDKEIAAISYVSGTITAKSVGQQEVIPATGHIEVVDAGTEATCKESGWTKGSHCEICGEILKTQEAIPALEHDWKETSRKEATSSEDGEIIYTCQRKNCGATDIKTLPATGV